MESITAQKRQVHDQEDLGSSLKGRSPIQAQNDLRLRVNRIAIVQELKVDHVLLYLREQDILTEEDEIAICAGTQPQDQVRLLIDILPTKSKSSDWYKHFCISLKTANVPIETRKKYNYLIDFMENTIIEKPVSRKANQESTEMREKMNSITSFSKYSPLPNISGSNSTSPESNQNEASLSPRYSNEGGFSHQRAAHVNQVLSSTLQGSLPYHQGAPPVNQVPASICQATPSNPGPQPHHQVAAPSNHELQLHRQMAAPPPQQQQTAIPPKANPFSDQLEAPENFQSVLKVDQAHLQYLKASDNPSDNDLYKQEQHVLANMRHLELAFAFQRRNELPPGVILCFSKAVQEVLFDINHHHLYFKYFIYFKAMHMMDIAQTITGTYRYALDNQKDIQQKDLILKIGFHLVDFLQEYGYFQQAEMTMEPLMRYLGKIEGTESLIPQFEANVRLMSLRNMNFDFHGASQAYYAAQRLVSQIELLSFGKDLLDCGEMYLQTSVMMREKGSIGPGYSWAQKALEEVEPDNHRTIIRVLCNAVQAYAAKWNVKRGEQLAIQAVKQSRVMFGVYHPMYVLALQQYVIFSNEFRRDEFGVEVARVALDIAEKMYGQHGLQVAECHKLLAEALMANEVIHNEEYSQQAHTAFRMAMDHLPGQHPKLSLFRITLVRSLITKGDNSPEETKMSSYVWAEKEVTMAMNDFGTLFGGLSIPSAQVLNLHGTVMARLDKIEESEKALNDAAVKLKLCQQLKSSPLMNQARAVLGMFLVEIDKPMQGIGFLKQAIENTETPDVYIAWVNESYEGLVDALISVGNNKQAHEYKTKWIEWKNDNLPLQENRWIDLNREPEPWEKFMEDFQLWIKRVNKIKGGLKKLSMMEKTVQIKNSKPQAVDFAQIVAAK